MHRCETCSKLFLSEAELGDECPVDGSDRRSLRRLWVAFRCGDIVARVAEFPFTADRMWARTHFGSPPDGYADLAFKHFPLTGSLLCIEEEQSALRLCPGTNVNPNHIRVPVSRCQKEAAG